MKNAFMLRDGYIVSVSVPSVVVPSAFALGSSVTFKCPLDLGLYGFIPAGTSARVSQHDFTTGLVDLELIGGRPATVAAEWGEHLTLMPFLTEEVLAALNGAVERLLPVILTAAQMVA